MGTYPTKIIVKSRPMSPRPNWPHPLPRPLKIPGIMDLVTLADVRTLLGRLQTKSRGAARRGALKLRGSEIHVNSQIENFLTIFNKSPSSAHQSSIVRADIGEYDRRAISTLSEVPYRNGVRHPSTASNSPPDSEDNVRLLQLQSDKKLFSADGNGRRLRRNLLA